MVLAMWLLWAAMSSVLFGLMVYRGTLSMHEGDQLVLDDVTRGSYTQAVHENVVRKLSRIEPLVRIFTGATAVMSLLLVSFYVYNALHILNTRVH
jgi:hypothetical protein